MAIPKTQKASFITETSDLVAGIQYLDVEAPQITDPNDIIIKNKYAGVNYIESYFRKGLYPVAQFPYVFGREASGEIAAVGDSVKDWKVGDKVAYLSAGTFAQYTKVPLSHVQITKLPQTVSDEHLKVYGSSIVQVLTALTLVYELHAVQKGDFVLIWAAAGGVGQILVKLVSHLGGRAIAVASTDEKLQLARLLGAEFTLKSSDDIVLKVKEITKDGVAVVYDGVGKDTFDASLDSLARKGTLVTFGNASGAVPPLNLFRLSPKNLKVVRPQLYGYLATKEEWGNYSQKFEELVKAGVLKVDITTFPLSEYKQVAERLESRATTGKQALEIPQ